MVAKQVPSLPTIPHQQTECCIWPDFMNVTCFTLNSEREPQTGYLKFNAERKPGLFEQICSKAPVSTLSDKSGHLLNIVRVPSCSEHIADTWSSCM